MPRGAAFVRVVQTKRHIRGGARGVGEHGTTGMQRSQCAETAAAADDDVGQTEEHVVRKELVNSGGSDGFRVAAKMMGRGVK